MKYAKFLDDMNLVLYCFYVQFLFFIIIIIIIIIFAIIFWSGKYLHSLEATICLNVERKKKS